MNKTYILLHVILLVHLTLEGQVDYVLAQEFGTTIRSIHLGLYFDLGVVKPARNLLDKLQVDQVILELFLKDVYYAHGLVQMLLFEFFHLFEHTRLVSVDKRGLLLQLFFVHFNFFGAKVASLRKVACKKIDNK